LFVRGRKKEMIVTSEGLNVFPEDVERALNDQPGVRESAVVGVSQAGEERVHAVVLLEPGADADGIVRAANARLADHQRVRGVSTWPGAELPRTDGTRKLKRREIRHLVETGRTAAAPPAEGRPLEALLARYAGDRPLRPETTIEELGLSSLERVELLVALEERFSADVDETRFAHARTVADIQAIVSAPAGGGGRPSRDDAWEMPSWNRRWIVRQVRGVSLVAWLLPLARVFAHVRVDGLEHLHGLDGPVVFASNHQSHMDTPVILAALPRRWRARVAVAMAKDFFQAHFHPDGRSRRERIRSGALYYLAAAFFNAFPLPQREAGARHTLRYIGDLVSEGWSVLIYPEGERSESGAIGRFRPGVGMIGARLAVPVVPVRLEGVDRVLHKSWKMARPGAVRVAFGAPLQLRGDDHGALASQVEEAVRGM